MGDEHVFLVPKDHRADLLTAEEGLRIQSDDCDTWVIPAMDERNILLDFLRKESEHLASSNTSRFARHHVVGTGMRIGYNQKGVFIHANHNKRYFGVTKSSASVLLAQASPEAVPLFQPGDKSNLLGSLASKVTLVTQEVRSQFLHACFERADVNKNGKLSRPELGSMMRKVLHTMSAKDVEELMSLADADHNHQIDYKDGDGLVSDATLERMLSHSSVGLSPQGCKTLVQLLDCTHDGRVDYEEFCVFLFHRK
eukprot:TRINITY_DN2644_c0_g1_i3.p1 TRINITY_DN2644_c0_g1~~TRINITY_DN2644_c0_g1_i3.p1  ORF type:complete len:254 (-),score=43.21 TRINITY_DN2644_c0_g1_i3:338-1099(-)